MIAVIVPTYNAQAFLARTLDTVLAQTYPDWELIIVNDGSTDDTQAVADSYAVRDPRVRVLAKPNGGCAEARNHGFAHADPASEYIIFLDHDDVWEPHALQTLLTTAQTLPAGAGAAAGARVIQGFEPEPINQTGQNPRPLAAPQSLVAPQPTAPPITFNDVLTFNPIWTMGQALMRRAALEAAGPLDPQSAPADDWDIYLRLTLRAPFAATATPVICWRSHDTNTSKNGAKMQQAQDYVRGKMLTSPELSEEQRRFAAHCFESARRNLSVSQLRWAKECLARKDFGGALTQTRRALANYARSVRE